MSSTAQSSRNFSLVVLIFSCVSSRILAKVDCWFLGGSSFGPAGNNQEIRIKICIQGPYIPVTHSKYCVFWHLMIRT